MAEQEVLLKVEGMTCTNCATGISKALEKSGFRDAHANFGEGEVSFTLVEGKKREEAVRSIESLGYKVLEDSDARQSGLSSIEKKFLFVTLFTLPLFMHMFVSHDSWLNRVWVQMVLCTPVFLVGLFHFGRSALASIRAGMANMDVLIFTGSTAAFVYSVVGTTMNWGTPAAHNYLFFETSAMIITLVLLGNVIEHRAVKKTAEQIGKLSGLQADVARIVMRLNGKEKIFETDPKTVKPGDELQVNQGDRFPVDGKVLSGSVTVDESAITGESEPILKGAGDEVFSGTTLIDGNARITALRPVKDSTLEKIIDLVKRARKEQPDIQVLGDRVSAIFVPAVLGIASLTFVLAYFAFEIGITQSLMNAIAVLVISCPCAMGLATPTAVVAGVGRAAKEGILIKGGNTLERYAKAEVVIFDKTGTLTTGNFSVSFREGSTDPTAKSVIKGLEQHSSHPIAASLLKHLSETEAARILNPREVKGEGMHGELETGEKVFFGRDKTGDADLILAIDGRARAKVVVNDEIKPEAKTAVDQFKAAGLEMVILSGDRRSKVADVAEKLGIDRYEAEMSPDEKLSFIEKVSQRKTTVMVGDGINDGPSLSRAQVGISPGGASSLAIDSARVVLMRPDEMKALSESYLLAKRTYGTIKQNLFWAFAYNVVAIPIAAVGLLNPMVAALSMAFSDVIVIGNSLRLRIRKIR